MGQCCSHVPMDATHERPTTAQRVARAAVPVAPGPVLATQSYAPLRVTLKAGGGLAINIQDVRKNRSPAGVTVRPSSHDGTGPISPPPREPRPSLRATALAAAFALRTPRPDTATRAAALGAAAARAAAAATSTGIPTPSSSGSDASSATYLSCEPSPVIPVEALREFSSSSERNPRASWGATEPWCEARGAEPPGRERGKGPRGQELGYAVEYCQEDEEGLSRDSSRFVTPRQTTGTETRDQAAGTMVELLPRASTDGLAAGAAVAAKQPPRSMEAEACREGQLPSAAALVTVAARGDDECHVSGEVSGRWTSRLGPEGQLSPRAGGAAEQRAVSRDRWRHSSTGFQLQHSHLQDSSPIPQQHQVKGAAGASQRASAPPNRSSMQLLRRATANRLKATANAAACASPCGSPHGSVAQSTFGESLRVSSDGSVCVGSSSSLLSHVKGELEDVGGAAAGDRFESCADQFPELAPDPDSAPSGDEVGGGGSGGGGGLDPRWSRSRAADALMKLRAEAAARNAAAPSRDNVRLEYIPRQPARRPRALDSALASHRAAGAAAAPEAEAALPYDDLDYNLDNATACDPAATTEVMSLQPLLHVPPPQAAAAAVPELSSAQRIAAFHRLKAASERCMCAQLHSPQRFAAPEVGAALFGCAAGGLSSYLAPGALPRLAEQVQQQQQQRPRHQGLADAQSAQVLNHTVSLGRQARTYFQEAQVLQQQQRARPVSPRADPQDGPGGQQQPGVERMRRTTVSGPGSSSGAARDTSMWLHPAGKSTTKAAALMATAPSAKSLYRSGSTALPERPTPRAALTPQLLPLGTGTELRRLRVDSRKGAAQYGVRAQQEPPQQQLQQQSDVYGVPGWPAPVYDGNVASGVYPAAGFGGGGEAMNGSHASDMGGDPTGAALGASQMHSQMSGQRTRSHRYSDPCFPFEEPRMPPPPPGLLPSSDDDDGTTPNSFMTAAADLNTAMQLLDAAEQLAAAERSPSGPPLEAADGRVGVTAQPAVVHHHHYYHHIRHAYEPDATFTP